MTNAELETAFSAVKSIHAEPDWDRLLFHRAKIVQEARANTITLFPPVDHHNIDGFIMRGIVQAIACRYSEEHLARGMASTLRGVRNAFAERDALYANARLRSIDSALDAVAALVDAGMVPVPDGYRLRVEIVPEGDAL